jgi:hypothetical protein
VRWNGAQYVLYGSWYNADFWPDDGKILARSCNGRVWSNSYNLSCSGDDWGWCVIDFVSTAAMTVVVRSYYDHTWMDLVGFSVIDYSADLVTWGSAVNVGEHTLGTVVVGDP